MKRTTVAAILAALLLLVTPAVVSADVWQPSGAGGPDVVGVLINENFDGEPSFLISNGDRGQGKLPNQVPCTKGITSSGPCSFTSSKYSAWGAILLPACVGAENNCLEGLAVTREDGTQVEATFLRQTDGLTLAADSKRGLTRGSTVSLWTVPSVANPSVLVTYAAYLKLALGFANGKFSYGPITVEITPVELIDMPHVKKTYLHVEQVSPGFQQVGFSGGDQRCFFTEEAVCGKKIEFEEGSSLAVSVRATNQVAGWFKGRLVDPTIKVTKIDSKFNRLQVSAKPARVPKFEVTVPKTKVTQAIRDFYKDFWMDGTLDTWQMAGVLAEQPELMKHLSAWRAAANDRASGFMDYWVFGTSEFMSTKANSCMKSTSQLVGIVTTNAMVYQGTSPTFKGGYLNYQVAGMHYSPDGVSEVKGTYDLVVRSSVARCLYGLPKVPIYASISVTGGTDQEIATTAVSDDGTWLKLKAYGFTFSNKTIKVKIRKR